MSSCFFSSLEKIRISLMSDSKKRRKTALPKDPVPPVKEDFVFKNAHNISCFIFLSYLLMNIKFFNSFSNLYCLVYRTIHICYKLRP